MVYKIIDNFGVQEKQCRIRGWEDMLSKEMCFRFTRVDVARVATICEGQGTGADEQRDQGVS